MQENLSPVNLRLLDTKGDLCSFFLLRSPQFLPPFVDSTGQSVHVDTYLGNAKSSERQRASNTF